jgi:hypothetical protein
MITYISNISAESWRPVLVVEETAVPTFRVPDEGYSRTAWCALNYISTFYCNTEFKNMICLNLSRRLLLNRRGKVIEARSTTHGHFRNEDGNHLILDTFRESQGRINQLWYFYLFFMLSHKPFFSKYRTYLCVCQFLLQFQNNILSIPY